MLFSLALIGFSASLENGEKGHEKAPVHVEVPKKQEIKHENKGEPVKVDFNKEAKSKDEGKSLSLINRPNIDSDIKKAILIKNLENLMTLLIEPAPAPAIATFDEPIPTPPAKQLELDDPGPSAINPAPIETPTPPPEHETTLSPGSDSPPETTPKPKPSPTTKKNVPKPPDVNSEPEPEPFAKRVAAIISVWRNSRDVKNCRTQLAEPSLVGTISVSNTGEGTLKPTLLKDNIAAMVCLRRSFERLQFPTARVGEAPFKTIPFTLRSMN